MAKHFSREHQHTKGTIRRLSIVQYASFSKRTIVIQILAGVAFIYIGFVFISDSTAKALFLLFGGILSAGWKEIPKLKADRLSSSAELPKTSFTFDDENIKLKSTYLDTEVDYSSIYCLVEDDRYDFLFITKESAYMMRKDSDSQKEKAFRDFLVEKTNLPWNRYKSPFLMSFKSLSTSELTSHRNLWEQKSSR